MTPPFARPSPEALTAEILRRTAETGSDKSICPSEVARALAPEEHWRSLMGPVRDAALALLREGRIEILRKGKPVSADAVRGVIRLRAAGTGAPREPDEA
ncbi:DUF3253 domain-containing protein [Teichococcus vastitatis]|jgi:hypothetical protein|uniref:DUF3253 domain-containing protein n=1 Tax=Teichococcus vastitatis TaxID=2307076 RepID=UPI000E7429DA|nr:DUF3253 domain-containing protein [Pseudoroseomonas vastitatis]